MENMTKEWLHEQVDEADEGTLDLLYDLFKDMLPPLKKSDTKS